MDISDYIKAERNKDNNIDYNFRVFGDSSHPLLLKIKKITFINQIKIICNYEISKDTIYEILNYKYKKPEVLESLRINFSLNFVLDYLKSLSLGDFENKFQSYLVSIIYKEKSSINENDNNEKLNQENEENIFEEYFYSSRYKIKYNSFIFTHDTLIGYGLFDKDYKNHYTIIVDQNNFFNSSIHKNGILCNKKELFEEINDLIEENFKNFFKLSTAVEIGGDKFYSDVKLIIINTLKKNNIDFKIIQEIDDIIKEINSPKDIIYIIRLEKHMSIFLKLNQIYYSLDTSLKHLQLLKKETFFKNNIEKLKYFSRPIQSSGSCSYYSIKFLEIIMTMKSQEIIENFNNGDLLMKVVNLMQNFFITLNNSKLISDNSGDISTKNKNITLIKNNTTYYLDNNIFINKFIKIKSLYKCFDLDFPENINEIIENQAKLLLVIQSINLKNTLNKNLEIYDDFIEQIKSTQKENYKNYFIKHLNYFLDNNLRIYEEEKDNANNIIKYAKDVLDNNARLSPIEVDESLILHIFNLTINQDMTQLNSIKICYDKNCDNFKFLKCLPKAFNNLEENDKSINKFEEGSEEMELFY